MFVHIPLQDITQQKGYTTREFSHENAMNWQNTHEIPHENGFMGINQCYEKQMKNIMHENHMKMPNTDPIENPMKLLPHEFAMKD